MNPPSRLALMLTWFRPFCGLVSGAVLVLSDSRPFLMIYCVSCITATQFLRLLLQSKNTDGQFHRTEDSST